MPTLKTTKQRFKKIALTSGDPTGVGFEVACKALKKLGPQKNIVFFLYRDQLQNKRQPKLFKLLDSKFNRKIFASESEALEFVDAGIRNQSLSKKILIDLSLSTTAAHWVVSATKACLSKSFESLITGPISKTLIKSAGFNFLGHTGAFRQLCPQAKMHMAFVGNKFNVLLVTDHLPLVEVPSALNVTAVNDALTSARTLTRQLGLKKKIGLVGLNPHAGESGLIGDFETNCLENLANDVVGPLVPDAAFLKKNWKKYSLFVCMYHDQGLIPFKLVHGQDSGVHVTVGLPFVRTSVDHGTAFDIYNKNLANPASMLDAIQLNLKLVRG